MRFLLCNRDCQVSGGTTYLLMLAEGLLAQGHEVVLAAGSGMVAERFESLGVRRLYTIGGSVSRWLTHREAAHNPPDVVVFSSRGATRELAASVVRSTGAVGVCVLQDHVKSEGEANALREADAVIALEQPIYEQALAAGAPGSRLHCWPRPVIGGHCPEQPEASPAETSPYNLLWMGRMSGNKSWSALTLISAMPAIAEHITGVTLRVVGGGSRAAKIRRAAREVNLELGGQVISVLPLTNDPVAELREASLVIGGGYTCLEALYNGRPAIASGFEWMGPMTRERMPLGYNQHFGDRSTGRTDEAGITAAVCEMHDASLSGPGHRFQPQPDWFPVDHSAVAHAEQLAAMVESIKAPYARLVAC